MVAGLVGVGGAIVMIPLLYYIPPLLGVGALDIREVTGVTMAQVLAAALLGAWLHGRRGQLNGRLALVGGTAMACTTLAGAVASRWVSGRVLLVVFGLMGILALVLMYVTPVDRPVPPESPPVGWVAAAYPGLVGLMAGLVGAGGAFLLVPVLNGLLRVPFREAIGTSLAITTVSALAGFAGKALTRQVPLWPAVAVVVGSLSGTPIGAHLSRRAPVHVLRHALAVLIALATVRVWADVFFP